jgi:hypothetical protein
MAAPMPIARSSDRLGDGVADAYGDYRPMGVRTASATGLGDGIDLYVVFPPLVRGRVDRLVVRL